MLMNKEILLVAEAVSNEKSVPKEFIFQAIEAALAMATQKRHHGEAIDVRVEINRNTGDYKTFRCWTVVEDEAESLEDPANHLTLTQAKERNPKAKVGTV